MLQVLNKSFFLPPIGTGEEIKSQYQQLAQVIIKKFVDFGDLFLRSCVKFSADLEAL